MTVTNPEYLAPLITSFKISKNSKSSHSMEIVTADPQDAICWQTVTGNFAFSPIKL